MNDMFASQTAIIMYHRVCPLTPETACYFARGTAITPDCFARQVEWLAQRFQFRRFSDLWHFQHSSRRASRPVCVLTFDDGYRDLLTYVLPILKQYQAPACVFPVASHLSSASRLLWVDQYYGLIHQASGPRLLYESAQRLLDDGTMPSIDEIDLRWWVRGELKEKLQRMAFEERIEALDRFAMLLQVQTHQLPAPQMLYLSFVELMSLRQQGHEVGGHGDTHQRLTCLSDVELKNELHQSFALLEQLKCPMPRGFCYPDGDYNQQVMEAVAAVGFDYACTVVPAWCDKDSKYMELPRFFLRQQEPGTTGWPLMKASEPTTCERKHP